jgi:hypothetical protein
LEPLTALAEALHRFDLPWIEVGRIYRRMCFLRLEGLSEEAHVVEETEFAAAAAKAREAAGSESEADTMMKTLLAEAEQRVAEAIAFAEVLVPMLTKRLAAVLPSQGAAPAGAPRRPVSPGLGEGRGIADFIDDMLAQERAGPR